MAVRSGIRGNPGGAAGQPDAVEDTAPALQERCFDRTDPEAVRAVRRVVAGSGQAGAALEPWG